MNPFTRRTCVVAAAAALGAVLARFSRLSGVAQANDGLAEDLAQVLRGDRFASAQVVGREYLRYFPAEANKAKLNSLIRGGLGAPGLGRGPSATREWLSGRTRKDFEEGRVVEVQGWVLSATEARLCALSALS